MSFDKDPRFVSNFRWAPGGVEVTVWFQSDEKAKQALEDHEAMEALRSGEILIECGAGGDFVAHAHMVRYVDSDPATAVLNAKKGRKIGDT